MKEEIQRIQNRFRMKPHPEGGFFGNGSRSSEFIRNEYLPSRYTGPRNIHSSIYFMVTKESPSKFHKLKTDELWHFYSGDPIQIHLLKDSGHYSKVELSSKPGSERFQYLVKQNTWMAATCVGEQGYTLVGCSLAPGFEFEDFQLADREKLLKDYPNQKDLIVQFT